MTPLEYGLILILIMTLIELVTRRDRAAKGKIPGEVPYDRGRSMHLITLLTKPAVCTVSL